MLLKEIETIDFISKSNDTFETLKRDWTNLIKKSRPYLLGTIGQFRIGAVDGPAKNGGTPIKIVVAYDLKQDRYAAFLQLERFSKSAYAESIVSADKAYRGINLPLDLYSFLIKEEGMIIVSDEVQTIGARSIWERLARESGIDVYGYNTKTKKVFQVDAEDLFNEDVYDDELNAELDNLSQEAVEVPDNSSEFHELYAKITKLKNEISEVKNHIRLFAARSR